MTDVFISYSRKDIAFARLVHQALLENGLETWIDWQDIPPSADWLAEVYGAIEGADAFVFVISDTSLASEICGLEISHAAEHNKRLIPIVIKDVDAGQVPKELAVLNWIFFEEAGEKFEKAIGDLVTAITVDQDWVKKHTRFENRALDWERKGSDRGLLLRGVDLTEAESWLAGAAGKNPQPTALQTQYILKSREDATRRQRQTLIGVGVALVVAVGLGILAWTQRNVAVSEGNARATAQYEAVVESEMRATAQVEAEEAQLQAEHERDTAISRQLSSQSSDELDNGRNDIGLLLAIEAIKKSDTKEAYSAIRRVFDQKGALLRVITNPGNLISACWNNDESLILTAGYNQNARIWSVKTGEELLVLDGHEGNTWKAEWSPDESRIVTVGNDNKAIIWDAASGEQLWSITAHDFLRDILWNSDGTLLLSSGRDNCEYYSRCKDGSARLWNAITGSEILYLSNHTGGINWAKWNSDESQIMFSEEDGQAGTVRIHDAQTGAEVFSLGGHHGWVDEALWSYDKTRIMSLQWGGPFYVWDALDGHQLFQVPGLGSEIRVDEASWSPSGEYILTIGCTETKYGSSDCVSGKAQVWDGRKGAELISLAGDQGAVLDAIWSRDGERIFTSGTDGSIMVWNALTGNRIMTLAGQLDSVNQLLESPDGKLLFTTSVEPGTSASDAIVWDIETGEKLMTLAGDTYGIRDAIWSADEERILTFGGEAVRVWQVNAFSELPTIDPDYSRLDYISWNQDGSQIMTAGCDEANLSGRCLRGTARIWDADSGVEIMVLSGHTSAVVEAVWNADESKIITASLDATARIWDAYTGEELIRLEGHRMDVNHVSWSPDEEQILTASFDGFKKDNSVRLWEAETGAMVLDIPSPIDIADVLTVELSQAEWNQDGSQIITFNVDDDIRILDAKTGQELHVIQIQDANRIAWSGNENRFASGHIDGVIRIWDLASESEIMQLLGHSEYIWHLSWSSDDSLLLSASQDGTARVWDTVSGEELLTLVGHSAVIDQAYWSNDESMILTVSRDSTARVWDAVTGDELMILGGHSNAITTARWNNDDTRILTDSSDGTVQQWYVDYHDLLQNACERAPRNFSSEEWKRYFGNATCEPTCSNLPDSCTPEN